MLVFPVYAGVILQNSVCPIIRNSVPRVCGGDPSTSWLITKQTLCSPCMRG
nr:MAG TPA: hypothetical protein [Caudoviricetes sp.]